MRYTHKTYKSLSLCTLYIVPLYLVLCPLVHAQTPLSLDSCLKLAEQNNLQLRNAQLDVEKAEQVKKQALTKYFPQVSGYGMSYHAFSPIIKVGAQDVINAVDDADRRTQLNDFYQKYGSYLGIETLFSLFHYGYSFGASAVQPVFMGGQIITGNQLAKVGVQAAQLESDLSRRDLLMDVEETYWLLVGLQSKQQTLDAVTAMLDTIAEDVETAVQAGLATETDRLQIRLRRAEQQNRILQLTNGINLARQALCQRICLPLTTDVQPADTLPAVLQNVPEYRNTEIPLSRLPERSSASRLPDIPASRENAEIPNTLTLEEQLLDCQVKAQYLRLRMEISKTLPQIAIGATYGYHDLTRTHANANGMVFATLQVPLTQWWETGHKIKEQKIALQQAENEQQYLTEQLHLRQLQLYQQMVEALQQEMTAETNLQDARENLRLNELNYRAGLTTLTALMQAQTTLEQALSQQTDARIQYLIARKRYEQQFR